MRLSVSETARLTGVSVRTLHYYDEIGLLHPSEVTDAGYRYYDEQALQTLQQILFFRELEFPLKEIAAMLQSPQYDRRLALARHRELLLLKRQHLDALLALVDDTLNNDTGKEFSMDKPKHTVTAADLAAAKAQYAAEAAQKWGATSEYAESERRWAAASEQDKASAGAQMAEIFAAFAALCAEGADPAGEQARALVRRWQAHITRFYYPCTDEILAGLGQMYTADARFAQTLNAYGPGTARFMGKAIHACCKA